MLIDDDAGSDRKISFRRKLDIRQDADANDDEISRNVMAVAQADAGNLFADILDTGRLHPEMNANAGRGVPCLKVIGDFCRYPRAPSPAAPSSITSTSSPLARAVAANSRPMKPAPITATCRAMADPLPQRLAFVEDTQILDVGKIGVGKVEQGDCARRSRAQGGRSPGRHRKRAPAVARRGR